jgi:RNA polymerase sigma-70 factor, ECF subfamily
MRALATRLMAGQAAGHTLGATALAHEAYIKLVARTKDWDDREHAIAAVTLAMRQVLVDHARRKQSAKRSRSGERVPIEEVIQAYEGNSISIVDFHDQLERLFDVSPRIALVVALHLEHGYSVDQIALMLDLSPSSAARLLERGLRWLR